MDIKSTATLRLFGLLRESAHKRGIPATLQIEIDAQGTSALEIASRLDLPVSMIEGVFVNHSVYGLEQLVFPGDRVAFVPHGTPGPHRYTLGLYAAGRAKKRR